MAQPCMALLLLGFNRGNYLRSLAQKPKVVSYAWLIELVSETVVARYGLKYMNIICDLGGKNETYRWGLSQINCTNANTSSQHNLVSHN